jgi:hypothetical protein
MGAHWVEQTMQFPWRLKIGPRNKCELQAETFAAGEFCLERHPLAKRIAPKQT